MIGYPLDSLHREVAYIAYHFHWPWDQIMNMEHRDRHKWIKEIAEINRKLNEAVNARDG